MNLLVKHDARAADLIGPCRDHQYIVDRGSSEKVDLHPHNRERKTLGGKLMMMHAFLPKKIGPPPLHKMQKAGVVDPPGKIGVLEIDPLEEFVPVRCQATGKIIRHLHR